MDKEITLLFAAANTKAQKIDTGVEYQLIRKQFQKAECIPLFNLSADNIGRELDECGPHILHLSAHGTINGKLVVPDVLEEELRVNVDDFAALLSTYKSHLGLVVFCACHSDAMAGKTARRLPVSIGFKDVLDDDKAKLFSERFYTFLNENPADFYDAYLRAKKECSLKGKGTPRFYFRETAPYQWNEAAWKNVFRLLQEEAQLEKILEKVGLPPIATSKDDVRYFDQLYYAARTESKLFKLRNALDDDVLNFLSTRG